MSYIGNPIISTDFPRETFSGSGSTTAFTMSIAPASVNAVIVVVSGITQDPSTYTISGTTLTFSAAPPTGTDNISVRHLGVAGTPQVPADASVTSAKLASGAALSNIGSSQLASANLPAGSVLQVVNASYGGTTSTSSSTYSDTGLTASIIPKYSTSKILAIVNMSGCGKNDNGTYLNLRLVRNSTSIALIEQFGGYNNSSTPNFFGSCCINYLDSPATTSSTTYKVQFASGNNVLVAYIGVNDSLCTITLLEIAQ